MREQDGGRFSPVFIRAFQHVWSELRAGRKPMLLLRFAERTLLALLFQLPPRYTRFVPDGRRPNGGGKQSAPRVLAFGVSRKCKQRSAPRLKSTLTQFRGAELPLQTPPPAPQPHPVLARVTQSYANGEIRGTEDLLVIDPGGAKTHSFAFRTKRPLKVLDAKRPATLAVALDQPFIKGQNPMGPEETIQFLGREIATPDGNAKELHLHEMIGLRPQAAAPAHPRDGPISGPHLFFLLACSGQNLGRAEAQNEDAN